MTAKESTLKPIIIQSGIYWPGPPYLARNGTPTEP
jgi:hypothetical protein